MKVHIFAGFFRFFIQFQKGLLKLSSLKSEHSGEAQSKEGV